MMFYRYIVLLMVVMFSVPCWSFSSGLGTGVGASFPTGLNVFVGYTNPELESAWLRHLGVRFDFATTGPLKSAIDSIIDNAMSNGQDIGDGIEITDGKLDAKHLSAVVDVYPFVDSSYFDGVRISGGYYFGDMHMDTSIKGQIAEISPDRFYFYLDGTHYYYNGNNFRGMTEIDWEYNGPYLGLGWDIKLGCGFYLYTDIGAVFTNRPPTLTINIPHQQLYTYNNTTGVWEPFTIPKLDSDVANAQRDANHKLADLRILPMVKVGFLYRF